MLIRSGLGPLVRALRHSRGAATLLVLEVGFGATLAAYAYALGEWTLGTPPSTPGHDATKLTLGRVLHPGGPSSFAEDDAQRRSELSRLRSVPDVLAVSAVTDNPVLPRHPDVVELAGLPSHAFAWRIDADDDLLATMDVPLVVGRSLAETDVDDPERPAVLSEDLASRLFPTGSPVGALVRSRALGESFRVVGIARSHAILAAAGDLPSSLLYVRSHPALVAEARYVVRTKVPALASRMEASLADGHSFVAATPLRPDDPERENGRTARSFARTIAIFAWCVVLFGALATSSFLVAQRTKQIGIRRALGARKMDVVHYFLLENALLAGVGVVLGATLAFGIDAIIRRSLPLTTLVVGPREVGVSGASFLVASLGAALVPALHAARIRPTAALQRE